MRGIMLVDGKESIIFWQDPTWIAAVTGFSAIIFSFFTLYSQKKLAQFQIRTEIKEKVIADLKENVASLITYAAMINDTIEAADELQRLIQAGKATSEQIIKEGSLSNEYKIYRVELFKLTQKVAIFLDKKHKEHAGLIDKLQSLLSHSDAWRKTNMQSITVEKRHAFLLKGMEIQREITEATQALVAYELKEVL